MRVAIVGYGVEGKSAVAYWAAKGAEVTVLDEREFDTSQLPVGVQHQFGEGIFEHIFGYDIVMRSPGIAPYQIRADGHMTSVTREFFTVCPAPIIGVTGSKGKGTTCSLIHAMLKQADIEAYLVGNIGVAALDVLPCVTDKDVVVYELSSFQLWDLERSPATAVVLMIEPEHLNMHHTLDGYLDAKANIVRHQTAQDAVIYHPTNAYVSRVVSEAKSRKITYTTPPGAYIKDDSFYIDEQKLCSIYQMKIVGKHNLDNICAAITAVWQYTQDVPAISRAIASFTGLDHRLKFVREVDHVKYYDDSIATTPGSAIAALKAFEQPKVLILGGSDKGANFSELAEVIAQSEVRQLLLIGAMRHKLKEAIEAAGVTASYELYGESSSMADIVAAARKSAVPGDVVVISPACASFDMFKNYKDRGEQFIAAVQAL